MSRNNAEFQADAYEAVARLFIRTLTVPQIFFEAAWPDSDTHVDVLAIDRAGSGDLHVVLRPFDSCLECLHITDGLLLVLSE